MCHVYDSHLENCFWLLWDYAYHFKMIVKVRFSITDADKLMCISYAPFYFSSKYVFQMKHSSIEWFYKCYWCGISVWKEQNKNEREYRHMDKHVAYSLHVTCIVRSFRWTQRNWTRIVFLRIVHQNRIYFFLLLIDMTYNGYDCCNWNPILILLLLVLLFLCELFSLSFSLKCN